MIRFALALALASAMALSFGGIVRDAHAGPAPHVESGLMNHSSGGA